MSAYLQRLLARAAPGAQFGIASGSIPVAPLTSPLALHDQRLGLPEFDAPVPGEVADEPTADPAQDPIPTQGPRNDHFPTRKPSSAEPKQRPELRIVTETRSTPAMKPADLNGPKEAPKPEPEPSRHFRPGPLDIDAGELEPALAPVLTDAAIVAEPPQSEPVPQRPKVARPKGTDLAVEPAERRIPELPSDVPTERPRAVQDERPRAEEFRAPAKALPVPAEPQSHRELAPPQLDLEPVEQRLPSVPHETPELSGPRAAEPVRERSVSIGEIVIDVHEPPRAQFSEAGGTNQAPATAAAASVIGPLPIRLSTVSLFGMRRR